MGNIAKVADRHKLRLGAGGWKIGRCRLKGGEFANDGDPRPGFIQAEINRVLVDRHGRPPLPDCRGTDEMETCRNYLMAVASGRGDVHKFYGHWMPWWDDGKALDDAVKLIRTLEKGKRGQKTLPPDSIAKLLGVTFETRQRLRLKNIGACDMSTEERKRRVYEEKKAHEKDRIAAKRRAAGIVSRAETRPMSEAARKPWMEAGMSRRTWYRRKLALECCEQ